MNLNDFVVLSKNKAKSVKLNARNLQELQVETGTQAQESKEMEVKLQRLKESMSKEKEERGHSAGFKWKSGQCGTLKTSVLTNRTKKNRESRLQKLSADKVKIRVLKDEPLTAPPQPPPPPAATTGLRTTRKNRLRGAYCGQCEVKTAGLMCAECTEDYCIGCFTKFHQKGALKLHRMIPIQTHLQTHVSTRDVVSCVQKQNSPSSYPGTFTSPNPSPKSEPSPDHTFASSAFTRLGDQSPEERAEAVAKPVPLHSEPSQVLVVNRGEGNMVEMTDDGQKTEYERDFLTSLLRGEYNEEESARSFQEALRQWRGKPMTQEAMWTPVRPVSVSAMATQADLTPDRGAEGRGGGGGGDGRVPVRVEFTESSLSYMDRLLLKKHRRTPVETYHHSSACGTDLKSQPDTYTDEEAANSLTAQEEDFRHYCASLFAVPVSSGRTEPQITAPESCLVIEVLDERDRGIDGVSVAEQRTDNNSKVDSIQHVLSEGRSLVAQTTLTSGGSSRVSCSSPSLTHPSTHSRVSAQPKAALKLHLSKPQTSQAEHSVKSLSSKSKPSACPAAETPRTSNTSIKTPASASQKPNCSPTVHKSNLDCGSSQLLSSISLPHTPTEIPKSSQFPVSFRPDVSPLDSARPRISEEPLSPSQFVPSPLRSTFTVSPSSSTESALLPKVYQSTPLQKDSSLLPEQPQSPQLLPEPYSPVKLSQSFPSNLESRRQSQHSLCDPESLLSDNQLQQLPSPVSSSPNPPPTFTGPSPPVRSLSTSSLCKESAPDAYSRHRSTYEDAPIFMSSTPLSGDHESTLSYQDPSSHLSNIIQNSPVAVKMEEEEELSTDSGDEMSSDSLGLAVHEEDSSDEEEKMHIHLRRGRSREEEQGDPAISHLEDSADAGGEKDSQTDEHEQLSEPSMVMHKQSAGSGSEQFCDLDGFLPLGLDVNSGHSDTPGHTHCDSLHTRQTAPHDSDPTGSEGFGLSSGLSTHTEEHLVFRMMKDTHTQPTGIQIHSTTPTRREDISANELGTSVDSEFGPALRPVSRAAQEIMEICSVDQTGCEDPDLDTDTTAHTLHGLEQELRLMTKETEKQASGFGTGNSGNQDQRGYHRFTQGRVSEEQKDEEAAAQRDRQSVLLLP